MVLIVAANLIQPPWQGQSETETAKEINEQVTEGDWETRPWTTEEAQQFEPQIETPSPFEREQERARSAWEEGEGYWTRINDPGDMPTRSLWKSADRRDDGTPGIAPWVRKRLSAGQRVLVYDGPVLTKGIEMWKVTDGETFGWISELQLESVPEGQL